MPTKHPNAVLLVLRSFGLDSPVLLEREPASNNYAVRYGETFCSDLTISEAFARVGECLLHSAACAGTLEPSNPGIAHDLEPEVQQAIFSSWLAVTAQDLFRQSKLRPKPRAEQLEILRVLGFKPDAKKGA
jgi:hypothetical protein